MTFLPSRETLQAGERLLSGPRPAVTGPYELAFRAFLKAEESSTERLMSFYMQARFEMADYIGNLLGQVPQPDLEHYRQLQAGLDGILGELDAGAAKWADESAAAAFAAGKGISGTPDFTTIHDEAVRALSRDTLGLITNTSSDIRRSVQQEVAQALIGSIRGPELVARLTGTGLSPGPWKTLEERAGVIARTETMRAFNTGNMAGIRESGAALVVWITSEDEAVCRICGPRDGTVYMISAPQAVTLAAGAGADTEWLMSRPRLDSVGGAPPAHPRCRCTIAAHFRGPSGNVIGDPQGPPVEPDAGAVGEAIAEEMPSRAMTFDDELASLKSGKWRGVRGGIAVDAADPARVRFWRKHPALTQGQLETIASDVDLTTEFVLARYGVNVNLGVGLRGARGAARTTPTKGGTLFKKNAELRLRMLEGFEQYHRAGFGRYVSAPLPDEMDEQLRAVSGSFGGIGRNRYLHQVQVHGTFRRGALADMSDTGTMRWDAVTAAAKYIKPGSHVRHGGEHAGATGTHVHEIAHAIGNMFGNPKYLGSSKANRLFGRADSKYGHNTPTIDLDEATRVRMWEDFGGIRRRTAARGFGTDSIGGAAATSIRPAELAMMKERLAAARTRIEEIRRVLLDEANFEAAFAQEQRNAARLLQRPPDRESFRAFLQADLRRERSFESTYERAVNSMEQAANRAPPAAGDGDYWPTDYAQTNLWEDFAETVSLYLLNPERLREWSPERWAWLRRYVFPEGDTP